MKTKEEQQKFKRIVKHIENEEFQTDLAAWEFENTHDLLKNASRGELIKLIKALKINGNRIADKAIASYKDPGLQNQLWIEHGENEKIRRRATNDLIEMNALDQKNWQDWSEMVAIGILLFDRFLDRAGWL